jgi:ketosteroid isomerase-like protein
MTRSTTARLGVVAVAVALAWSWCCGDARAADATTNADVARLTQLSNAWDKAIVAKDRAAVAGNMREDFRIIDGQGEIGSKQQFVEDILDPKLVIDPYTVDEFDVRLYGEVALLSGRTHMTGKHDGKPFESNYRYIDIYVKRSGEWRIVSVQITRLPKPAAPN